MNLMPFHHATKPKQKLLNQVMFKTMSRFLFLFCLLLGFDSFAATDVQFNLQEFGAHPYANRPVTIQQDQPFYGMNLITNVSDQNGIFYMSNAPVADYQVVIQRMAGANSITFQITVTATNLGTIDAYTITSNPNTQTYPVGGQSSWSILTSDQRYQLSGTTLSNTFYPLFSNPSNYVNLVTASNIASASSGTGLTNGYSTNTPGVTVNNQNIYVSTNYDTLGAALAVGLQSTNYANQVSNALQALIGSQGISAITATNISLAITLASSNLLYNNSLAASTNISLAISLLTSNNVYNNATNSAGIVSQVIANSSSNLLYGVGTNAAGLIAQAIANTTSNLVYIKATNSAGPIAQNVANLSSNSLYGVITNFTGNTYALSNNGVANNLTVLGNLGIIGSTLYSNAATGGKVAISVQTGDPMGILQFQNGTYPGVGVNIGSNWLTSLHFGGDGGAFLGIGPVSNTWSTNLTGLALNQVTNIANSLSVVSQGITNQIYTNTPQPTPVVNQIGIVNTNYDTRGGSNSLYSFVTTFSNQVGSTYAVIVNGGTTNLSTTNTALYGQTAIELATNILSTTNIIGFYNAGVSLVTNAAFEWIPGSSVYSNRVSVAILTNNGTAWNLITNGVTLYTLSGLSPLGSWTSAAGSGTPLSVKGFYFVHDRMVDVGWLSLTNLQNYLVTNIINSTNGNFIIISNGFGTNLTLIYPSGGNNLAGNNGSVIAFQNAAWGQASTNSNGGKGSAILSGATNSILSVGAAAIVGGIVNSIAGLAQNGDTIAGGISNIINGVSYSTIGGGEQNNMNAADSFIGSGQANQAGNGSQTWTAILGGAYNTNYGSYSSILGGQSNTILGLLIEAKYSVAAGKNTHITNANSFLWSDGYPAFTSSNSQFLVYATNGLGVNTNITGTNALRVNGTVDALNFTIQGVPVQTSGNFVTQLNGNATNLNAQSSFSSVTNLAIGAATNTFSSTNIIKMFQAGTSVTTNGSYEWQIALNLYTNRDTTGIITNTGSQWILQQPPGNTLYSSATITNNSWAAVGGSGTASSCFGYYQIEDGVIHIGSFTGTNLPSLGTITNIIQSLAVLTNNGFSAGQILVGDTSISRTNSAGGFVMLNHLGTNVSYPSLELAYAASSDNTGDCLDAYGYLNLSNGVLTTKGSTLVGHGCTISNYVDGQNTHAGIIFSDNFTMRNVTVYNCTNNPSQFSWIGFTANPSGGVFENAATNWTLENVRVTGSTDCLLLQSTNYFQGTLNNCMLTAIGFDFLNILATNASLAASTYSGCTFNNCTFRNLTPSPNLMTSANTRGSDFIGCSNIWNNCFWIVDNTTNQLQAIGNSSKSDIEVFNNCSLMCYGTNHVTGGLIVPGGAGSSSFYLFNNFSATVNGWTGANTGVVLSTRNGTTMILNNVNIYGTTNMLNLISTAGALATGGNVFYAQTTPANLTNTVINPVISGGTWTNTTGLAGTLQINYTLTDSAISGNPGLNMTNLDSGDYFNATNGFVLAGVSSGRLGFKMFPGERLIVTNFSSGSANATVTSSFFRP